MIYQSYDRYRLPYGVNSKVLTQLNLSTAHRVAPALTCVLPLTMTDGWMDGGVFLSSSNGYDYIGYRISCIFCSAIFAQSTVICNKYLIKDR